MGVVNLEMLISLEAAHSPEISLYHVKLFLEEAVANHQHSAVVCTLFLNADGHRSRQTASQVSQQSSDAETKLPAK